VARDINRQIEQRIQAFAQELNQLVRQAALEAVQDALGGQRTARPTFTAARPAASAPRGRRGAGGRRSPGQMEQMMASVRDYVAANPGTRMEKLSAAVGASTAELRLPVLKLLEEGAIRKQGEKRATEYFPGNGRAQASRKRSTAKKARRRRAAR
jgi:hypothetical protein